MRLICSLAVLLVAVPAWAVTITSSQLIIQASAGSDTQGSTRTPSGGLPITTSHEVSAAGRASAMADYDFANSGFDSSFTGEYATASQESFSVFERSFVTFSVAEETPYLASGLFSAISQDLVSGEIIVALNDDTVDVDAFLFRSVHSVHSTSNYSFTLGVPGGDLSGYSFSGSLSGTLVPGHEYTLFYRYLTEEAPTASLSQPTSTSNTLSLLLVPEPSTALLIAGGLLTLAALRRPR